MLAVFGHSAGKNETELGKVTAPQYCCLHPEGLALWSRPLCIHWVATVYVYVFNVCVLVCRLRSVKMEQRKLSDQANTLVDLSKVRHTPTLQRHIQVC